MQQMICFTAMSDYTPTQTLKQTNNNSCQIQAFSWFPNLMIA